MTIALVAALRRHGMRASQTIDGAMTGKKFLAYVEQCLAPTLKRKDIVMVDKLRLRSGMIPIINQMSAAGVITLPGMMTGQILAGMDPLEAAKYQILLLFLLSGGAGLGALAAVYVAAWRITDERDRLRLDRLAQR